MQDRVIVSKAHADPWDPSGFRAFAFDTETGQRSVGRGDTPDAAMQDAAAKGLGRLYEQETQQQAQQVGVIKDGEIPVFELQCNLSLTDVECIKRDIDKQLHRKFVLLPVFVRLARVEAQA